MFLAWTIYLLWSVSLLTLFWMTFKARLIPVQQSYIFGTGLFCFFVFSYMFIVNRGSNVAQLSETYSLWRLWARLWIPLSILSLFTILGSFGYLVFTLFQKVSTRKPLVSLALFVESLLCAYHIILKMPDA